MPHACLRTDEEFSKFANCVRKLKEVKSSCQGQYRCDGLMHSTTFSLWDMRGQSCRHMLPRYSRLPKQLGLVLGISHVPSLHLCICALECQSTPGITLNRFGDF